MRKISQRKISQWQTNVGCLSYVTPAYDLLNTNLHVIGDDFGLDGGLFSKHHRWRDTQVFC